MPVILVLATVGVLIAAAITAVGMHFLAHWEWVNALLFGGRYRSGAARANSIVFLLIGMQQPGGKLRILWYLAASVIVLVTLGRAATV